MKKRGTLGRVLLVIGIIIILLGLYMCTSMSICWESIMPGHIGCTKTGFYWSCFAIFALIGLTSSVFGILFLTRKKST
ncbi:MAG: hypothetical protein ABH817_01020 [archaeon]